MKSARTTFIPPPPNGDLDQPDIQSNSDVKILATTLSHLQVATAGFDSAGKCVFSSQLLEEFIGFKPNDIKDLSASLVLDQDELPNLSRIFESVRLGKSEPPAAVKISGETGKAGIYTIEIIRTGDVEEKGYAVLLKKSEKESAVKWDMQQVDRLASLGRITAGVAHEFNNILTSVLGWTQIARQKTDSTSTISPALEIIEGNARRARNIASRLLGMSRPPSESCSSISMVACVEEVLMLMSSELENEKIHIVRSFEGEDTCFGDENRLGQVFINIIRNAMDAMPGGGTLYVDMENKNDFVEVSFRDTGPGIDPTTLARIFDSFFTTKLNDEGPQHGGTGLGLSICRDIIKELGGTISVDSKLGKGTTFTVSVSVTDRISSEPEEENEEISKNITGVSVLVVDDEPDIGEMICTSLKIKGLDTEFAKNGEEALTVIAKKKFDTAFVDFTMPGLAGYDLLREIGIACPDLKIIVMSGREVQVDSDVAIAEFLKKPFDLDDIYLKLIEVMERNK